MARPPEPPPRRSRPGAAARGGWTRRGWAVLAALCLVQACGAEGRTKKVKAGSQKEKTKATVSMLWPIPVTSLPLSGEGGAGLEAPDFEQELADIGFKGFMNYLNFTLPRELEANEDFSDEWAVSDHSRVNLAFQRWQRRAFARHHNLSLAGLAGFADDSLPEVDGVEYAWPELYENPAFQRLQAHIEELARQYLARAGQAEPPARLRTYVWVEVFRRGDAMRPGTRMDDAHVTGRYFASAKKTSFKLNFLDARGINPPYGKTFGHVPYRGNIVLHPKWVPTFITPNMKGVDAVCFSFSVYPPDGAQRDWSDDPMASMIYRKHVTVPKPL